MYDHWHKHIWNKTAIYTSNFGCFSMNENTWDFMQNIFSNYSLQFQNSSFYTSKVRNSLQEFGMQLPLQVLGIHPKFLKSVIKKRFEFILYLGSQFLAVRTWLPEFGMNSYLCYKVILALHSQFCHFRGVEWWILELKWWIGKSLK